MWKVTAKSDTDAEILLYDIISDFESEACGYVNARGLINRIKALGNVENITLRINSVGGDVFEAQAMYSYLRSHPANITVRVDGLAASSRSNGRKQNHNAHERPHDDTQSGGRSMGRG